MCSDCKYGRECSNGIICQNPQSDNFDVNMDFSDTCIKFRKIKTLNKKEIQPVVIEEHISNPVIEIKQCKKTEPKNEKSYKNHNTKINDEIYVIVRSDHIAGFESCVNEFGGKHIFYHEEELAKKHCEKLSKSKIKYGYVKCKIRGF